MINDLFKTMKVRVFIIALLGLMIAGISVNAQTRYSAEVDLGYTLSVGSSIKNVGDRLSVSTTHGVLLNEKFLLGAGVAVDYFYQAEEFMLPLFINVKGILPLSDKLKGFVSADVGYSFMLQGDDDYLVHVKDKYIGGIYLVPSVGIKYKKLKFQFGYSYLRFYENNIYNSFSALQFKVGFMF